MSANPLLSIEGLTASVDEKTILHNVNLNVAAGETHVLMGPNGAGKSTLGHLVMGDPVYTVNDGRIVFDGQDITELTTDKRSRAGLFLSFQAPVEIPGVPLSSFLRASIAGRPGLEMKGKEFRRRVKELAAELNMDTAYLNRELGVGFSGGEKKKVEMLQLLLLQPKLAILDEIRLGPRRRRPVHRQPRHGRLPQELRRLHAHHHTQHAHLGAPGCRPRPRYGQGPHRARGRRLAHPLDRQERF